MTKCSAVVMNKVQKGGVDHREGETAGFIFEGIQGASVEFKV